MESEFAKGNEMLAANRRQREGKYGAEARAKIAQLRQQAKRIEDSRSTGMSLSEVNTELERAGKLRAQADNLERQMESGLWQQEASAMNTRYEEDENKVFGDIQAALLAETDAHSERVNDLLAAAYDPLVGVDDRDKRRQIENLLAGAGQTDDKGNRYTRFSPGGHGMYRAVLTPSGRIGFVVESRGGMGDGE